MLFAALIARLFSHYPIILILTCASVSALLYPPPSSSNSKAEFATYDFIVIGAGTAGLALGARLSEANNISVLVLDGGLSPETIGNYKVPGAAYNVLNTVIDSAFSCQPDRNLLNRQLTYHAARALGGTSTINGLTYSRGSSSLYDNWQALGNANWSWSGVFPYFQKSTTFNPPQNLNYSYATFDPNAYGNGPVQLGYPEFQVVAADSFVQATQQTLGIPLVQDVNLGNAEGIKQTPNTIDSSGLRSSCYDSYYQLAKNRSNFDVFARAPVNLIALNPASPDQYGPTYTASHVVVADESLARSYNVTVRKEIILSGGAHQGPQLLMLSGIGPRRVLESNGVTPYLYNENVGQNHQDGYYITINVRVQANTSIQQYTSDIALEQAVGMQFQNTRQGPDTTTSVLEAWQKLSVAELQSLNATGLIQGNRTNQTHLEYLFYPNFYPNMPTPEYAPMPNESYISPSVGLVAAQSVGNVTLKSNQHGDSPVINLNYLSNPEDINLLVYGFKNLRKILNTPQIQQYTIGDNGGEVSPGPSVQTDEEIIDYIRSAGSTAYHACGTCAMKPRDQGGVVDERLRVYGVPNLRVVDASIFPIIPDAHTQGPIYMVAEKAADMIKYDWGL